MATSVNEVLNLCDFVLVRHPPDRVKHCICAMNILCQWQSCRPYYRVLPAIILISVMIHVSLACIARWNTQMRADERSEIPSRWYVRGHRNRGSVWIYIYLLFCCYSSSVLYKCWRVWHFVNRWNRWITPLSLMCKMQDYVNYIGFISN